MNTLLTPFEIACELGRMLAERLPHHIPPEEFSVRTVRAEDGHLSITFVSALVRARIDATYGDLLLDIDAFAIGILAPHVDALAGQLLDRRCLCGAEQLAGTLPCGH